MKIGIVVRDMQIEVYNTKNHPPVNGPLKDMCVEIGDTVDFLVTATDKDNYNISLKSTSGLFFLNSCRATFTKIDSIRGKATSRFRWIPCHQSVRNQPYDIIIKSEDDNPELRLFDIDNMRIKVLGPSPVLVNAIPEGKFIRLTWNNFGTGVISGFSIYRRETASSFLPDSCTAGIPPSAGFTKVGYVSGSSTVTFVDTDNGQGLQFGKEYIYRIVAVYPNGTESKASNEVASTLVSGIPVIRNVSVRNTDAVNGSVYISWKKPDRLDTIPAIGPYEYVLSRAEGISGTVYQQIASIKTVTLNDTVYIDSLINTQAKAFIYKIELYNDAPGNRFMIGDPSYASSVFIELQPGDRKSKFTIKRNVPWINSRYDIFRFNSSTSSWDSVGTTSQLTFNDTGVDNGTEYRYYVRSTGAYQIPSLPKDLVNFSQKASVTPVDNEAPCIPALTVSSQCDSLYNTLRWTISDPLCMPDIAGYKIWYKLTTVEDLALLTTINDKNTFVYRHDPGEIIAGCYAVSAFDAIGNESEKSAMICVDSCNFYEIPNVFTPNGDAINDILVAKTSGLVEKVDFRLFNRNGMMLFQTSEPKLDWDGTYKGKIVSPGVYFYQCDVTERRISGTETFHISGFIHVITEKGATVNPEPTRK
jgi:gliding motility-associated-like protein